MAMESFAQTVACHDCDLLQRIPPVPAGGAARCPRCRALLSRSIDRSFERTTALGLAALILFVVANAFPFLTLEIQGRMSGTTIIGGTVTLWRQGSMGLAGLVFATTFIAPLLHISLLLWVVAPLSVGRIPPFGRRVMRWLTHIRPWSMAEVFMLGVLVSMVKLADMAAIVPGIALWAFAAMIPVLAGSMVTLDTDLTWRSLAPEVSLT